MNARLDSFIPASNSAGGIPSALALCCPRPGPAESVPPSLWLGAFAAAEWLAESAGRMAMTALSRAPGEHR